MLHLLCCYVFYPISRKFEIRLFWVVGYPANQGPPPPFPGLNCSMEKAATVRFKTYILYTGSVLTFK